MVSLSFYFLPIRQRMKKKKKNTEELSWAGWTVLATRVPCKVFPLVSATVAHLAPHQRREPGLIRETNETMITLRSPTMSLPLLCYGKGYNQAERLCLTNWGCRSILCGANHSTPSAIHSTTKQRSKGLCGQFTPSGHSGH